MNRLANVEAYRLSSVVDEALESLRFLSRLTSDDVSKLAHVDGSFNNQLKSETRFKALFEESIRMDRRPKELDGAGAAVRASTKEICRAIKTRQQLANAVNDQCRAEESDGMANIINTLTDLKKIVRIKLCTTVEQEETKNENIAALTMRAKDAQKDVEEFEIQLRIERNKKEKNLSKFNDIITKLNAELEGLKEKIKAFPLPTSNKLEPKEEINVDKIEYPEISNEFKELAKHKFGTKTSGNFTFKFLLY